MSRKDNLLAALTLTRELVTEFVDQLSAAQRNAEGDYTRWSAKDNLAHTRAWVDTTLERIAARLQGEPGPSYPDENERNAQIYQENTGLTFEEAAVALDASLSRLIRETAKLSDEALESTSAGPAPLWRGITSNGLTHLVLHLATYFIEQGQPEVGMSLFRRASDAALTLDDSPEWRATEMYNHACMLALNHRPDEAIPLLREALTANPSLVEWSKQDTDLVSLHGSPAYEAIYTEMGNQAA